MSAREGGCLCGGVRYRIDGELGPAGHCHCSICRRTHGAAFGTYVTVSKERFRWLIGDELRRGYESTPGSTRYFCSRCGSPLACTLVYAPDKFDVTVATLDDASDVQTVLHVFVGSKAPWFEITDALPQFEQGMPGMGPNDTSASEEVG